MLKFPKLAVLGFAVVQGVAMVSGTAIAQPQAKHPAATVAKAVAKPVPGPASKTVSKPDAPLLPSAFAGWELAAAPVKVTDPAKVDPDNAAALKEYGFSDGVLGEYTRDGETLKIKAERFGDASGAYGAYTFFRHSGWPKEEIGSGAASDNNRVLFWVGNVFVDAGLPRITAMSAAQLRELAASIPVPAGNKALAPPLLGNLPQKSIQGQTTHYALGPLSYVGPKGSQEAAGVLPPGLVGFDRGAETVTVTYKLQSGLATLTVINYPTPQMAAAQAKAIGAYLTAGNTAQHPFTKALQESNPTVLEVRRSGPLVAVVSGDPIQDDAHKLVSSVHYEAETANVPGQATNEVQKTAQLLVGIIMLVIVMFAAALLLAFFLGGGRAAYRFARGKPLSSVYDEEFTRLDLD